MRAVARILPSGVVRVAATPATLEMLKRLPYLHPGPRAFETWWTYVPDLRRDLAGIHFLPGSAEALRDLLAAIKTDRHGDDDLVRSWFVSDAKPRPFQLESIHFGLARERLLLADATGLGKTISSLGIMLGFFARGAIRRAVVIVPASLRTQWTREILSKAARKVLPARVKCADGPRGARAAIYRAAWSVLILSPETVRIDREELAAIVPTVGLAILDEASVLKNDNQTSRAIVELFGRVRRKIALTATPIENGLSDLYSIARFVDRRTFVSRKHFDRRYIVWRTSTFAVWSKRLHKKILMQNVVPARYRHLDEIRFKFAPMFMRRTPEDVGEQLPSVVFTRELVALGPRQRKIYDAVAERTKKLIAEDDLAGVDLLAPLQHLRGACDSPELVAEGRGERASAKTARIRELLDGDFRGEPVIIFTDFAEYAKLLERDLRTLGVVTFYGGMSKIDRRVAVDTFTRGRARAIIMTRAGERGLNLQVSGVVLLADIPWNPASIKQRIGRARRLNSKHATVRVRALVADDTVESKLILPKLEEKQRLSLDVVGRDELAQEPKEEEVFRGLVGRKLAALL